jgi:hypothetical protein
VTAPKELITFPSSSLSIRKNLFWPYELIAQNTHTLRRMRNKRDGYQSLRGK